MKKPNLVLFGLCLNFVILNLLDAIITIIVIEHRLGAEINGLLAHIAKNSSLYHTMGLKIFFASVAMYIVYALEGKYDTLFFKGHNIKGIYVIYFGVVLINLICYIIVINGLIVLFFPTVAPFKAN